ncbi:MAG: DUF4412 domain-containing protein [Ignavibacteria bacterium]|nr:DUF4412 domain-containing protein [Ignavibacteria bacterium]
MKNVKSISAILTLIFFIALFSGNNIFGQKTFEGKIKYKLTGGGKTAVMDYFTKGKNIRVEVNDVEKVVMIMKGKDILILMPGQKMYMKFPSDMMSKKGNNTEEKEFSPEDLPKFKTGKSKKINGYNCDQYIITDENNTVELWATKELGNFFFLEAPDGGEKSIQSAFNNMGFVPMIIISKNKAGKEEMKMEATEIKKMSIESSMFDVPGNYKEFDMKNMFNQE